MHQSNNVQKYTFSKFFFISLLGLVTVTYIVGSGAYMAIFGEILNGSGQPIDAKELYTFLIPVGLAGVTWFLSLYILLYQFFIYKESFSKSDEGLHHLLVGGTFLVFVFIIPIKFISFDQLEVDKDSTVPRFNVKKEHLKDFNWFTRFLLSLKGFRLTMRYAKLDVTWFFYIEEQKKKEEKDLLPKDYQLSALTIEKRSDESDSNHTIN